MRTRRRTSEAGLTLLEILVALLLISVVALTNASTTRALGIIGVAQNPSTQLERPARLRTLGMEYVQAELEYLANRSYEYFRDASRCDPTAGLPTPFPSARRVPTAYLAAAEPRLPSLFAAADILLSTEPVVNPGLAPDDCRPRRITVNVYRAAADAPSSPGGSGGTVFVRGETAVSAR